MEVYFIPAHAPVVAPPPFPEVPHRPARRQVVDEGRRATARSAPPDTPKPNASANPVAPALDTSRLLDIAAMAARAAVEPATPTARDPTQRQPAKLPGRVEPYTPEAIQLRERISPADIVAFIGSLTGGNYDPCPDTRSKLRDLAARNDPRDRDELMILIDRERRRCPRQVGP